MTAVLIKMREIRERLRLVHGHLDELIGGCYTLDPKICEASKEASSLEKLVNEQDIVEHQVICLAERVFDICNIMGGTPAGPRPPELDDMLYACGTFVNPSEWNMQR